MTKGKIIFVSILLIVSSAILQYLIKDFKIGSDKELINLFSGICFGAGISILISTIIKKRKKVD